MRVLPLFLALFPSIHLYLSIHAFFPVYPCAVTIFSITLLHHPPPLSCFVPLPILPEQKKKNIRDVFIVIINKLNKSEVVFKWVSSPFLKPIFPTLHLVTNTLILFHYTHQVECTTPALPYSPC